LIAGDLAPLVPGFFASIDEVCGYFLAGPATIFNGWTSFNNCVVLFQVNSNQFTMIFNQIFVMIGLRLGGFLRLLLYILAQSLVENDLT
jgi:hypothetical protein